jgi:hypothetical protein
MAAVFRQQYAPGAVFSEQEATSTAQTITAPLVDAGSAAYGPILRLSVVAPLVDAGAVVYAPSLATTGPQTVSVPLVDSGAEVFRPAVEGGLRLVLLGGGPGSKRKQIEKGSYLERLLSAPLVDRLERIKPEAAEVIEEIAVEAVEQEKPVTQAAQVLRTELKNEGIAYREAYREVLAQVVAEMRQAQEEEEELAIALAIL